MLCFLARITLYDSMWNKKAKKEKIEVIQMSRFIGGIDIFGDPTGN